MGDEFKSFQRTVDALASDAVFFPLTAEDFDLIEEALADLAHETDRSRLDAIYELRDRLKRARLLP